MSSPPPPKTDETDETTETPVKKVDKVKLILLAVPVVLLVLGAGLWFSGILPPMLGMEKRDDHAAEAKVVPPTYIDLPEMVANLNSNPHKPSYIKLTVR